jgi:hypothetical protein
MRRRWNHVRVCDFVTDKDLFIFYTGGISSI